MTLQERLNNDDRFAKSIGAQLVEVREGYARARLTVEEQHLNGAGVCQGGVIYTLADLAFAALPHEKRFRFRLADVVIELRHQAH